MTLDEIRSYVRSHLDLDASDLPDSLVDVWIREGSQRIERSSTQWPFYETTWTLSTSSGTADYDLAVIAPTLSEVYAIRGPQWELTWMGRQEGDDRWPRSSTTRSEPTHWSLLGTSSLRLYPTPDATYSLEIRGQRKPLDWMASGAGSEPDFPAELHSALASYVVGRAYLQQEDEVLSQLHMSLFQQELDVFRSRLLDTPPPRPLILNGTRSATRGRTWFGRLRYPWE